MRRSLILLVLLLVVAGCGRGSFVGRRLDNFSAYYNTFYNAERAFQQGVKAIEEGARNQAIDENYYMSIFGGEERAGQTKPFDDAIQKSADVLRDHPDSKWVDDALLLIGKSYFYLKNYVGAEQKFREIMTLESPLEDEARFWLARTLIASEQYDDAIGHLEASLLRDGLSRRWEPMLRLALGELYVRRGEWENAVTELEAGLESVRDSQVGARAQFLLGQIYETLERYDDAVAAYERVRRYNPFYELGYSAQYSAVRVEGLHGDPSEALDKLRRMERDDKNYANRAELAYLRGRIYQAAGRPDDAYDAYVGLLYDTDANINTVLGQTHYALGELYRDAYVDYSVAAAHFDTAATSLRQTLGGGRPSGQAGGASAAQDQYAPAAITDSGEQARIFASFATVEQEIALMDSLLYLGSLDDEAFAEKVLALRQQRAAEIAAQQAERERREAEQRFAAGGENFGEVGRRGQPSNTGNNTTTSQQTGTAGFLFHKDPVRVQESVLDFEQRWGNRPLVPNWRRLAAISGVGSGNAEGGGPIQAGVETDQRGIGLPEVDISAVPRDDASREQLRAERAVARYELGNVLFLSMNRPDSAAVWYRMVIDEAGDEPVAQRAYYALAEVQRALGDTLGANRLYRTILDRYPRSDFARRARERLGLAEQATSDSLALAETAYERAYAVWQRDDYRSSLNEMLEIASRYRTTDVAPRALLAAGSIYQEWAARDSLELFDALPLTVPDSLLRAAGLLRLPPSRPDTTTAPATASDTLAVGADSLAADAERLATDPDSLATDRRLAVDTDSLTAAPDSLTLGADSLSAGRAPADTTAAPEPEPVRLETLYAALVDHYPQSPQATQAGRILKALEERWAALQPPDTTTAADSLALAATDSTGAPPVADSTAVLPVSEEDTSEEQLRTMLEERRQEARRRQGAAADSAHVAEQPVEEAAERRLTPHVREHVDDSSPGAGDSTQTRENIKPIPAPADAVEQDTVSVGAPPDEESTADRAEGGWTIVVASQTNLRGAEAMLEEIQTGLADTGYPIEIFSATEDEATPYRIGLGFFTTEDAAQAVRDRLAEQLPQDAWLLRVPPAP